MHVAHGPQRQLEDVQEHIEGNNKEVLLLPSCLSA